MYLQFHLQPPYFHWVFNHWRYLAWPSDRGCFLLLLKRLQGRRPHRTSTESASETGGPSGKAKEVDDPNLPSLAEIEKSRKHPAWVIGASPQNRVPHLAFLRFQFLLNCYVFQFLSFSFFFFNYLQTISHWFSFYFFIFPHTNPYVTLKHWWGQSQYGKINITIQMV